MSRTPEHYVSENESLMREWDYKRNSALGFSPDALGINSSKIVWWICPQGHKYDMRIGNVKKCAVGKHPKSEKLGSTGQAACCARIHSRYFTGGSPSGLRV